MVSVTFEPVFGVDFCLMHYICGLHNVLASFQSSVNGTSISRNSDMTQDIVVKSFPSNKQTNKQG